MLNIKVYLVTVFISFITTVIVTKKLIPILRAKKLGQKILEIGPNWHKSKEGTPTMGGIGFIIASMLAFALFFVLFIDALSYREQLTAINVYVYALLNCLIGLIDDLSKIRKAKNEGLTPKTKLIFQIIAAGVFLISLHVTLDISTELFIPFFNLNLDLGFFYYIFSILLLCGMVNAVNLTDGIDGLASSVTLTVGILFSLVSFVFYDDLVASFFGAFIVGGMLGFLVFNAHPARIFMGDTGSLFLGALIVGLSFAINNPLLSFVFGFVFLLEAISDILQVVYFKITNGKRLFKMAPLHHHFEKCGLKEKKIVLIFTLTNFLFCIFALFGLR